MNSIYSRFQLLVFLFLLVGCSTSDTDKNDISKRPIIGCAPPPTTDREWYNSDNIAPLFDGLDAVDFKITTDNDLVQRYFNQGLALAYGFNHAEAARSFYYASKLDSNCAMAFWGYAYVLGPNYNAGMESDNYERAYVAIRKAIDLAIGVSKKEGALILALSERYVKDPVDDRTSLDIAYSNALKKLSTDIPDDADIATLYAESLMNLHPWDLWSKDGTIKEWTPDIIDALDNAITLDPNHIGAHHFYIHAVEMSKTPELGYKSAKLFDDGVVPGAGHLVHMPSHIYIRTGDYHKGSLANINAIMADSNYITSCRAQGSYPLAYYPHNYHFLAGTATLEGNSKWAIKASLEMSEYVNEVIMQQPGWGTLQHYYTIPYYVNVKFGKWEEILAMTNFDSTLKYPEAVRHYARGMAFLGKGDIANAKIELEVLEIYANDESLKELTIWDINSMHTIIQIAERVLKAEVLASEKSFDESIQLLKEAVVIEDALNYNEPPDWFFSVRHHLGAVEIEAGKYDDAIATYNDDLDRLPKNGWALHGLKLAYSNLGDSLMADQTSEKLELIWATADVELTTSRMK